MSFPQLAVPMPLSSDGTPPVEWCIFKAGDNATTKGVFRFTSASAKSVMAEYLARGIQRHGDYNHLSLLPPEKLSPEAGRASCRYELAVRDGEGGPELWAVNVKWTPLAAGYIRDKEYFHTSAAFRHSDDGEILTFVNLALTNDPATLHQPPLVAASAASSAPIATLTTQPPTAATTERKDAMGKIKMNEQLRAKLAAAMDGEYDDEEQCSAALRAALGFEKKPDEEMKATAAALTALTGSLASLTGKDKTQDSLGVLAAWKSSHEQVSALTSRIEQMENDRIARDFDAAVEAGRKDCKLSPAQVEKWIPNLRKAGKDGLAQLTSFLETAPKLVNGAIVEQPATGASIAMLTAEEREACRQTGVDPKLFLEDKKRRLSVA